eukprot:m.108255 g.108255  ORF g.108255 m.108255 type:complete len:56 (-) comp27859_c1_seq1:111-278(-)
MVLLLAAAVVRVVVVVGGGMFVDWCAIQSTVVVYNNLPDKVNFLPSPPQYQTLLL